MRVTSIMNSVTIYSRPGCHLCDDMKAVVKRLSAKVPIELSEVDVSTDPALDAQYGQEIPVLFVNGRKAAKFRIAEDDLTRLLISRADR